jgi:hypothetical protein
MKDIVSPFSTIPGKSVKEKYIIFVRGGGMQHLKISCQFLHFAKTEDIGLKSALKVERGVPLTSGRTVQGNLLRIRVFSLRLGVRV